MNQHGITWEECASAQARRFWSKVNKDGPVPEHRPELGKCWVWTGWLNSDGYGRFAITLPRDLVRRFTPQKYMMAHRLAYMLTFGFQALPDEQVILHGCDNPACVNPAHLTAGTQGDNRTDCTMKGRTARGATNGRTRLTEEKARTIIRLRAAGLSLSEIANITGESRSQAYQVGRRTWLHLGESEQ